MPAAPAEYRRPRPRLSDGSLSLAFSLKRRGHEIRVKLLLHRMNRTYRPTRRYARPPDSAATEFTIGTDCLNREGRVSALGKPFTGSMIQWIRYRYQIPRATLVRAEELTVHQVAEHFGVSANVVYYWIDRGVIQARRLPTCAAAVEASPSRTKSAAPRATAHTWNGRPAAWCTGR